MQSSGPDGNFTSYSTGMQNWTGTWNFIFKCVKSARGCSDSVPQGRKSSAGSGPVQHGRGGAQDCPRPLGRWFWGSGTSGTSPPRGGPGSTPQCNGRGAGGLAAQTRGLFQLPKGRHKSDRSFPPWGRTRAWLDFHAGTRGRRAQGSGKSNAPGRGSRRGHFGNSLPPSPNPPHPNTGQGAPGGRGEARGGGSEAVPRPAAPPVRGRGGEKPDLRRLRRERGCRGAGGGGGTAERFPPSPPQGTPRTAAGTEGGRPPGPARLGPAASRARAARCRGRAGQGGGGAAPRRAERSGEAGGRVPATGRSHAELREGCGPRRPAAAAAAAAAGAAPADGAALQPGHPAPAAVPRGHRHLLRVLGAAAQPRRGAMVSLGRGCRGGAGACSPPAAPHAAVCAPQAGGGRPAGQLAGQQLGGQPRGHFPVPDREQPPRAVRAAPAGWVSEGWREEGREWEAGGLSVCLSVCASAAALRATGDHLGTKGEPGAAAPPGRTVGGSRTSQSLAGESVPPLTALC